ncbi:hypothetical protein NP233_g10996 [Leucocoprinus birnbaumii]|uniref:Protein kinase domain-containing protein n=1 Tax=Leucocoprinus birnbaumii TaxID=56174 RepID=A0AAD5VHU6_9AGAR|nr:hypothetical protein NP233_g10996 [Leucocoprinus birnbaumii]
MKPMLMLVKIGYCSYVSGLIINLYFLLRIRSTEIEVDRGGLFKANVPSQPLFPSTYQGFISSSLWMETNTSVCCASNLPGYSRVNSALKCAACIALQPSSGPSQASNASDTGRYRDNPKHIDCDALFCHLKSGMLPSNLEISQTFPLFYHDFDTCGDSSVNGSMLVNDLYVNRLQTFVDLSDLSDILHSKLRVEKTHDFKNEIEGDKTELNLFNDAMEILPEILSVGEKRKALQSLEGDQAQILIDFLYFLLSFARLPDDSPSWLRRHILLVLRKLCGTALRYPRCNTLNNIRCLSLEGMGGSCDIYIARCPSGHNLCLKALRIQQKSDIPNIFKETVLWGSLRHPNVTPFYGVFLLDETRAYGRICLVSPWMENGNIKAYLEKKPQSDRKLLIHDVASGLQYLHSESIVHGDLKGVNVLVSALGRACIADFGLSKVKTDNTFSWITTTIPAGRTFGWLSPELLGDDATPTHKSDIWAFWMCLLRAQVGDDKDLGPLDRVNPAMWELIYWCWEFEPSNRPTCANILSKLMEELDQAGLQLHGNSPEIVEPADGASCFQKAMKRSPVQPKLRQVLMLLKRVAQGSPNS